MLDMPLWMKDRLCLTYTEGTIYVNPHNNAEYEFCEQSEEVYCPAYDSTEDGRAFEPNHSVSHCPSSQATRKRKRAMLYKGNEEKDTTPTIPFKLIKKAKQRHECMSKLAFIGYL